MWWDLLSRISVESYVNQPSKYLSFNPLTQKQTYFAIYETIAKEEILIECKESESKTAISCFFFTIDKGILAFNLFAFLSKKSPLSRVNHRL